MRDKHNAPVRDRQPEAAPGKFPRTAAAPPIRSIACVWPGPAVAIEQRRGAGPLILGVDIGATGALALLTIEGALVAVEDMPVLRDGPKGRPSVNPGLLAEIVALWRPSRAVVEFVGPRPGEGSISGFSFGRSRGVVEGVLAALDVPLAFITPASWKRAVGVAPGRDAKDSARALAVSRWPSHASLFARAMDLDRAEACLIGAAGLLRESRR